MKMTFIECSECAGHGGEGIYCEECLSTGHIVVCGPAAEVIDQLRADLAAATQRAEAAEATAQELQAALDTAGELGWYILYKNALAAGRAENMRAEEAEAALAAVPREAIRRYYLYAQASYPDTDGATESAENDLVDWLNARQTYPR